MKAILLFRERQIEADGSLIEMTIWRVPSPVAPSGHDLKYSLFYGRADRRIVGFDNERGKGDHMHLRGKSVPVRMEQLLADFLTAVDNADVGDE